jgi:primary-amine oxidase
MASIDITEECLAEYIWNYFFYQDGNIELEVRLTGMLQTYISKPGEPNPHGTTVAPQINAHYHQHLFSIRVDPMVDGLGNSVVETDIVPAPSPLGSNANFAGNAFATNSQVLKVEGARDYDWSADRRWSIVNPSRKHYASGHDVGYGIAVKGGLVPLLAKEGSWVGDRAMFASKPLWIVKDKEVEKKGSQRMWPSGKYVPQSRGEPKDSVGKWVTEGGNVENDDIVLFLTFGLWMISYNYVPLLIVAYLGLTHIPRPEDFPV